MAVYYTTLLLLRNRVMIYNNVEANARLEKRVLDVRARKVFLAVVRERG